MFAQQDLSWQASFPSLYSSFGPEQDEEQRRGQSYDELAYDNFSRHCGAYQDHYQAQQQEDNLQKQKQHQYMQEPMQQQLLLRHGRWTIEEEAFACCLIRNFERGLLNLAPGTSLRNFLADKLNWYYEQVIYDIYNTYASRHFFAVFTNNQNLPASFF